MSSSCEEHGNQGTTPTVGLLPRYPPPPPLPSLNASLSPSSVSLGHAVPSRHPSCPPPLSVHRCGFKRNHHRVFVRFVPGTGPWGRPGLRTARTSAGGCACGSCRGPRRERCCLPTVCGRREPETGLIGHCHGRGDASFYCLGSSHEEHNISPER